MEDQNPGIGVSQFCLIELPVAVLHEILFRLPVNSIMKLKFVCRALYKILCHPDFTVNYSKNSPFSTFLLSNDYVKVKLSTLYLLEISDVSREYFQTVFKPKFPDWSERNSILSVVGTCNGLFCVALDKWVTEIVYICNPITGECIAVAEYNLKHGDVSVEFGFGFCRSTNNYKVLKIVSNPSAEPESREGEVLTVGVDDTWRGLDRVANPTIPFSFALPNPVNLNDVLHWLVMDDVAWICTFEFEEEKMGRLSHPHGLVLDLHYMDLTSINNNQLCLVDRSNRSEIVMWKMKEYAVAESWTKYMVLDMSVSPEVQLQRLHLVRILENGDMLFSYPLENCSISYNPTKRELTNIEVPYCKSIDYSPSFLSLKEVLKGGLSSTTNVLTK